MQRRLALGQVQALPTRLAIEPLRNTDHSQVGDRELLEHAQRLGKLARSAVDEQHVGHRHLALLYARVAAREHLRHRAVVVSGLDALDVEAPVVRLQRAFGAEHHARRDRRLAARVADVEALEAARRLGQVERLRERLELALVRRARLITELRAVARVRHGHLDEARAIAAHARLDLHLVPRLARQELGERRRLWHGAAHENFLGRVAAAVVLEQERADDLVLVRPALRHLREVVAGAERTAAAEEHDRDTRNAVVLGKADRVEVAARARHELLRLHVLELRELIAVLRSALEVELRRRLLHPLAEPFGDDVAAPLEEQHRVLEVARVVLLRDQPNTRRAAALDLVLEARPAPVLEVAVLAAPELEQLL